MSITPRIDVTGQARHNGSSNIILNISSMGGSLPNAFAAYHHLHAIGIPLTTHNIGNVESAAVILYLAADTRLAMPHSRFLIHPFHWDFPPGSMLLPRIREALYSLEFDSARYADIFNERTQGADHPLDIRQCLESHPAIVGAFESRACGITTEPPAEQTIPTGAIHSWIA